MLELTDFSLKIDKNSLIEQLSIKVEKGSILTIMGPSGSGKSSILQFIAGFLDYPFITTGHVFLDSKEITLIPAEKRSIGIMFQDDLLFPHLNVIQNLILGMPKGSDVEHKKQQARRALIDCELLDHENSVVDELSGGQRTRISLWRTILSMPSALLMDEPFAKLDLRLKKKVRDYFKAAIKTMDIPVILVSHDHTDADWAGGEVIQLEDYSNPAIDN